MVLIGIISEHITAAPKGFWWRQIFVNKVWCKTKTKKASTVMGVRNLLF